MPKVTHASMVEDALKDLNEATGSGVIAIIERVAKLYEGKLPPTYERSIIKAIKDGVLAGTLVREGSRIRFPTKDDEDRELTVEEELIMITCREGDMYPDRLAKAFADDMDDEEYEEALQSLLGRGYIKLVSDGAYRWTDRAGKIFIYMPGDDHGASFIERLPA
jgi:hypothetical protein